MAFIWSSAGIGEGQMRGEASGTGRNLQGIAVAALPGVALHRGQVQGRQALIGRGA